MQCRASNSIHMDKKIFKYHRIEKNLDVWEDVDEELWQWEALYNDGTSLKQFDTSNSPSEHPNAFIFHQMSEIDQSKLAHLKVFSPRLNQQHFLIWNPERWKLVIKYIRADLVMKVWYDKAHFEKTGQKLEKQVQRRKYSAFAYGYENKVGGVVVKNFNVIMPNHEIITTDNLDNIRLDAVPQEEWI